MFITYREKLEDERWKKLRLEVLKRDGYRCVNCGAHNELLDVHHLAYCDNGNPWDVPMDKLITLCRYCHNEWHRENTTERIHKEPIVFVETFDPDTDRYDLEQYEIHRKWLLAIPVSTTLIENKIIFVSGGSIKSKKNALKKYDKNKYHYLLIGAIPASDVIDYLCRVSVRVDFPILVTSDDRSYKEDLYIQREYQSIVYRTLLDDSDYYHLIEEIKKRNNWGGYIGKTNSYSTCIIQSDVRLKLLYEDGEQFNGNFPKCICLNI